MRLHLLLLTVLLACTSSFAQIPIRGIPHRAASRNVVNTYCRMDYEGSRLLKDSWPRLKPLTTWKENPDWQGFTIVSQYEILDATEGMRAATVSVKYSVLGRFEPGIGYSAEPGREEVSFSLKDVDSEWKIDELDPAINPHVSKARAIAWLKTALTAEKDSANKIAIQRALKDLGATP
jgi:hypothetical protein